MPAHICLHVGGVTHLWPWVDFGTFAHRFDIVLLLPLDFFSVHVVNPVNPDRF